MNRTSIALAGLVAGIILAVAYSASAAWMNTSSFHQPKINIMAPGAPTVQTPGSAGEVHWTLSAKGQCVRFSCTQDHAYLVGKSTSAPVAAAATGNPLKADTVETFCLPADQNYVSSYVSAAATCQLAERATP